jgi:hypothetical protein
MDSTFVLDSLKKMSSPHVLYSFQGVIDESVTDKITEAAEVHFNEKNIPPERRKKFFLIMVECVQNVFHHQLKPSGGDCYFESGIMVSYDDQPNYRIVSGNYIHNDSIASLKEKIETMNAMTPEQLRAYYQEALSNAELSDKGGAGLGILDMARKSRMPLQYQFVPIDDDYSFFNLAVSIP